MISILPLRGCQSQLIVSLRPISLPLSTSAIDVLGLSIKIVPRGCEKQSLFYIHNVALYYIIFHYDIKPHFILCHITLYRKPLY